MARRSKAERAQIQWGEETGLRPDDVRARSYVSIGKTPARRFVGDLERDEPRPDVLEGAMNAKILIDFLKRLIKDMRSKEVLMSLDNLKVHHAKLIKT